MMHCEGMAEGMGGMMGMMGCGMGMALWLIALVVLVVGVAWLIQWFTTRKGSTRRSSAGSILEERFARGEIDLDEFERRRTALQE